MKTERPPIEHEVKTWPPYFQESYIGRKNFEVRLNDRDYRVMDILRQREWRPDVYAQERRRLMGEGHSKAGAEALAEETAYTGRYCRRLIGYILYSGDPAVVDMEAAHAGVARGHIVMSLCSTPEAHAAKRGDSDAARAQAVEPG